MYFVHHELVIIPLTNVNNCIGYPCDKKSCKLKQPKLSLLNSWSNIAPIINSASISTLNPLLETGLHAKRFFTPQLFTRTAETGTQHFQLQFSARAVGFCFMDQKLLLHLGGVGPVCLQSNCHYGQYKQYSTSNNQTLLVAQIWNSRHCD